MGFSSSLEVILLDGDAGRTGQRFPFFVVLEHAFRVDRLRAWIRVAQGCDDRGALLAERLAVAAVAIGGVADKLRGTQLMCLLLPPGSE